MPTNISRQMIVSPKSSNKSAHIFLTSMTDEQLSNGPSPNPFSSPECTVLPLNRQLSEIYAQNRSNGPVAGDFVTMDGDEVVMLTDKRSGTTYKYVGLVCCPSGLGADVVECWNEYGNPESGIEAHQLGDYPEERYGFIAIYRGCVSKRICPSEADAIRQLADQLGKDVADLDPDEIFCIQISAWVDRDEKVI